MKSHESGNRNAWLMAFTSLTTEIGTDGCIIPMIFSMDITNEPDIYMAAFRNQYIRLDLARFFFVMPKMMGKSFVDSTEVKSEL